MDAYDQNGNQISFTDARGNTTTTTYDQLNRQTRTTFPDGTFQETVYDQLGRRTAVTDQAGKTTQFFYDSLGRLIKVKDALNHETQYGYDELGQQITQIDAKGRTTSYEYDQLGRRTKRILPMGQFETYSYDLGGRLTSHRSFTNKVTSFAYDQLNRLLSETPDPSFNQAPITFTYNSLGQYATATGEDGTISLSYDNRNRLIQAVTPQGILTYTYNLVGNILSVVSSNPEGLTVEFGYDLLNRLQQVKDNNQPTGEQLTSYSYDQVGNLSSVNLPNGVSTSYHYNTLNRLTNVSTTKAGTTISSYAYSLGAAGNRLSVAELSGRLVNYSYDSIYRLVNETISGVTNPSHNGSVDYAYDQVGNRVSRTSTLAAVPSQQAITVDDNDRLTSDSYDDNGNTVNADGYSFQYDYKNRIIGVSGNGKTISLKYNAFGSRVEKSITQNGQTVVTKYLVDTNNHTGYAQVVEEIQDGVVARQHTYGLDLISQRQLIGGNYQTSFFGYDGHGSVRYLTDTSGAITDTYDYDSFGILVNQIGNTPNNYLYAGEQYDFDLGLYYNRARYLDVNRGRFWSQDEFEGVNEETTSLHKYLYTGNDPVNKIDPSGNLFLSEPAITITGRQIIAAASLLILAKVLDTFFLPIINQDLSTPITYTGTSTNSESDIEALPEPSSDPEENKGKATAEDEDDSDPCKAYNKLGLAPILEEGNSKYGIIHILQRHGKKNPDSYFDVPFASKAGLERLAYYAIQKTSRAVRGNNAKRWKFERVGSDAKASCVFELEYDFASYSRIGYGLRFDRTLRQNVHVSTKAYRIGATPAAKETDPRKIITMFPISKVRDEFK